MTINVESVCEFEGGPEPLWYMARGHVDKQGFVKAVAREFERDIPLEAVAHAYMRYVPTGRKGEQTAHISKAGPGAFPVTYIDLWCI
jgi:hypothetical protein